MRQPLIALSLPIVTALAALSLFGQEVKPATDLVKPDTTTPPVELQPDTKAVKPLKVLMVCGGCCHDYENQKMILSEGISARANVEFTIVHEAGATKDDRTHQVSIYKESNWAKGYDVVVHNECFGAVTDVEFQVDVGNVTFYGRRTDEQLLGDLLVAQSCGEQTQNGDFACGQQVRGTGFGGEGRLGGTL